MWRVIVPSTTYKCSIIPKMKFWTFSRRSIAQTVAPGCKKWLLRHHWSVKWAPSIWNVVAFQPNFSSKMTLAKPCCISILRAHYAVAVTILRLAMKLQYYCMFLILLVYIWLQIITPNGEEIGRIYPKVSLTRSSMHIEFPLELDHRIKAVLMVASLLLFDLLRSST